MRARTTTTTARLTAGVVAVAAVAVGAAASPALALEQRPPVVVGPGVPVEALAWKVALVDSWRSPTWKQEAGRTTVAVHLDCGGYLGIRLPQYYVQLVPEDGRMQPAVMPDPVPCGVTHVLEVDEIAGQYHLRLVKATGDTAVLRGKVAVSTP